MKTRIEYLQIETTSIFGLDELGWEGWRPHSLKFAASESKCTKYGCGNCGYCGHTEEGWYGLLFRESEAK